MEIIVQGIFVVGDFVGIEEVIMVMFEGKIVGIVVVFKVGVVILEWLGEIEKVQCDFEEFCLGFFGKYIVEGIKKVFLFVGGGFNV